MHSASFWCDSFSLFFPQVNSDFSYSSLQGGTPPWGHKLIKELSRAFLNINRRSCVLPYCIYKSESRCLKNLFLFIYLLLPITFTFLMNMLVLEQLGIIHRGNIDLSTMVICVYEVCQSDFFFCHPWRIFLFRYYAEILVFDKVSWRFSKFRCW